MTSLSAVRTILKTSQSEHAPMFIALMDENKFSPYKSKEFTRQKLATKGADYPTLGKKQAPKGLRKHRSANELRDICLRDLPEARDQFGDGLTYFAQSSSSRVREISQDTGMRTINTLVDPNLDDKSTIMTFPSDTLDQLCDEDGEAPDNLLRTTMTTCTVLPNNTLLPIYHSNEGTTVMTLLSGSVVWIFWPPTASNHRALQTAYEKLAEGKDCQIYNQTSFEGGMIFVQTQGDGLRIPPHSIMMALTTSTSVLAIYSEVTVENFISMLHRLPLLSTWFQTEFDGDRKKFEFTTSVIRHLDLLLNGHFPMKDQEDVEPMLFDFPRAKGRLLNTLLCTWDQIKDDVAAIMTPAEHKIIENIWETFLVGVVGRECRLCGKFVQSKKKFMKKHFIESHWSIF